MPFIYNFNSTPLYGEVDFTIENFYDGPPRTKIKFFDIYIYNLEK